MRPYLYGPFWDLPLRSCYILVSPTGRFSPSLQTLSRRLLGTPVLAESWKLCSAVASLTLGFAICGSGHHKVNAWKPISRIGTEKTAYMLLFLVGVFFLIRLVRGL